MSAMGAPPLAPTQEALALFAGDGGNSGSMPRRNNESANSLASLEETQRALVAPGSPPSEGAWEAPALGANVAGVFARAPASPMHVDARARLTASPSAGLSPISMALRAAPGRAKRAPPPAWAPGTRHASGATGAAHDDAGPEPPPPPFGVARPVKAQRPRPSPLSAGHDGLVRTDENHSPSGARKN